jgi:copper chaperone CopZ
MDGAAEPAPAAAGKLEKSYFDVLGICCPSEVPLVEKLLEPLPGVHKVSVVVPSRTVIVLHDASAISTAQIGNGPGSVSPCFPSGFPSQTRFSWASESKSVLFLRSTCSVPSSSVLLDNLLMLVVKSLSGCYFLCVLQVDLLSLLINFSFV